MVPSSLLGNDRTTLSWGWQPAAREAAGKRKHTKHVMVYFILTSG
jgi:hypothetical protein